MITLEQILNCETTYNTYYPLNQFFCYCQEEKVSENIEFLLLVRAYNPDLGPAAYDFFPANMEAQADRATYLYLEYIQTDAPRQVNINEKCRLALDNAHKRNEWQKTTFDVAYKAIMRITEAGTFVRFTDGTKIGQELNKAEAPTFSKNTTIATKCGAAYDAAKAARARAYESAAAPRLSAHPATPALSQAQIQPQPVRVLPAAAFLAAQFPAPSVPSACSSQGATRAFAAVTVSASAAVAEQASRIRGVLPASAANSPVLIISQAKPARPQPPPVPPLPASVLAKKKPVLPANQQPTPLPKVGF